MPNTDHDGEITVHELGRVMRNHGLNPTNDELKDMIRNVDKNSNGAIDFNEFIEMMVRRDAKGVVHQIVSPISNSESTNFFNQYLSWYLFQLADWEKDKQFWTNRKFVFSFSTVQTEKNSLKKFLKQIGENIWWIR